MTIEEHISNLMSVKEKNVDYIPLQVCLGIIADALIFLLNDKAESKDKECSTTKNDLEVIEDIKAEIELHHMNDLAYDEMSDFERGVLSIIDKHISGKENN